MKIYNSCIILNDEVTYFSKENKEGGCTGKKLGNVLHIIKLLKHDKRPLNTVEEIAFRKALAEHRAGKDSRKALTPGIKSNIDKFEKTWHAEPYDRYAIYEAFADLYVSFIQWA